LRTILGLDILAIKKPTGKKLKWGRIHVKGGDGDKTDLQRSDSLRKLSPSRLLSADVQ
jgi:hypothetical protein